LSYLVKKEKVLSYLDQKIWNCILFLKTCAWDKALGPNSPFKNMPILGLIL